MNSQLNDPVVDFVRSLLPSVVVEADTKEEPGVHWLSYRIELPAPVAHRLNKAFIDTVELIMCHSARIEQKRGLLFNHFKCEYESATGWIRISGNSGLRWMRAPKIAGRRHIYQSPQLVLNVSSQNR